MWIIILFSWQSNNLVAEWNNNCGNLSGAVGPYAVNEGIIKAQRR